MTLRIHVWLKRDYKIVMNKIIIACLAFASSYGFIQVIDPFQLQGQHKTIVSLIYFLIV
jgi:hypothetical protein